MFIPVPLFKMAALDSRMVAPLADALIPVPLFGHHTVFGVYRRGARACLKPVGVVLENGRIAERDKSVRTSNHAVRHIL